MKKSIFQKSIYFLLFICSFSAFGQNTLNYNDEKGSPKATLQDLQSIYNEDDMATFVIESNLENLNC